jgi:1,4-dihydroxy-2-naphthoyl-CoA hydrolase
VSADRPAGLPDLDLTGVNAFGRATGFRLTSVSGDRVTGVVEVGPDQHTPWGVVHGGVYCAVIEAAASVGASTAVTADGRFAVGVNNNTDFIRATTQGRLDVVAEPVQQGRTQQLWQVLITNADDGALVARGQVRLQNVRLPGGRPPRS